MTTPYEVWAVRYGRLETKRSDVFYRYHVYREPDAPIVMDYFFWVIRSSEQTLLVDTGFDKASGERRGRTSLIEPVDALARLDIAPEKVSTIVVTHCHYDHIGNLDRFPEATYVVDHNELAFWTGPHASHAQFAEPSEPDEIAHVAASVQEGHAWLTNGAEEIAPGVRAVRVGGHTPGQLIVVVDAGPGQVVLASDSLHFYEEMERDMPFTTFSDLPATYEAYDVLRGFERDGATVVAGHDPLVIERFGDRHATMFPGAVRIA